MLAGGGAIGDGTCAGDTGVPGAELHLSCVGYSCPAGALTGAATGAGAPASAMLVAPIALLATILFLNV